MYPRDDVPLRARMLIAQCREARLRLERAVAESAQLRARMAAAMGRPSPPYHPPRARKASGGGGQ